MCFKVVVITIRDIYIIATAMKQFKYVCLNIATHVTIYRINIDADVVRLYNVLSSTIKQS